jgi:hypothetical protein
MSERGYDVAGMGGAEFTLRLVPRQRAAPLYWRLRSHTHTHSFVIAPKRQPARLGGVTVANFLGILQLRVSSFSFRKWRWPNQQVQRINSAWLLVVASRTS